MCTALRIGTETYFGFILWQGKMDGMQDELACWLAPSGLLSFWVIPGGDLRIHKSKLLSR